MTRGGYDRDDDDVDGGGGAEKSLRILRLR